MPERGQYQSRGDAERTSRGRDPYYEENARFENKNQKPRHEGRSRQDVQHEVPTGGRQARQKDTTLPPPEDIPTYRDHHHQELSRPSRETSVYHPQEEYYDQPHKRELYNLRYILTSRGLCQIMEIFVNLLIVICAGVPYSNEGGYRDLASLGGIYHYYFGGANAFTGADADRVKELDHLFHQLKRPPYIFTMACGGVLMCYACVMLALGVFRVPYRCPPVLLGEALVNFLISLGYIPALAFYFIKLKGTYDNSICKEREQLYKSKGHQGFECQYHGADIAGGLFGVLGVFVFMFGAVLAVRAFRSVSEFKRQRANEDSHF
ncbi:MARVEL domain-containing protein 3 [Thalassophryne amazonica]|uniref:MARVEL domain-containing protein 3 n=1 Tax=Thalassophryne amazonica TaxID=390379 RepID=UPI001471D1FA|nr:MARVEL domain-containing protein 3 [Thalassophryne amazonica]